MMKNRTVTRLLMATCIAIIQLAGCSAPNEEEYGRSDSAIPIRIVAEINNSGVTRAVRGGMRTSEEWKEDYIGAEEYEKTIRHILLFAYKHGEGTPVKTIFYHPQGTVNPLDGITGIDRFEVRESDNTQLSDIALDLELMAGEYNFVLLVNCESGLKTIRDDHVIPDPARLTEATGIFTSDELKGESRKYLPMIGQCNVRVPENIPGIGRVPLSPNVLLERVHARIEFILTTVDESGEYLSPLLPLSRVTKLTLKNESTGYSLLPSAGEYTATGNGKPDIRGARYADNLPNGVASPLLPERESFHDGANEEGSPSFIARCKKRLLPYTGVYPKYIYVAPGEYSSEALTLSLSVHYPIDEPDKTYEIPLYNPDLDRSDNAYHNIRRNTVYRIFSTLKGPDNIKFDIVVDNWEDVNVDIPW